jgi:Na+/proline symporter
MAIDTRLNLGAAYLVNDFYKPYIAPDKSDRHYILLSRLSTMLLIVTALLYAHWITRVKSTFFITTAIGSGSGLVYILRWYWWRVNAWSEIAAMAAALATAAVFRLAIYPSEKLFNEHGFEVLLISAVVVTAIWILVTLMTPASDMEQLKHFYEKVRPAGPFWGPVARQCGTVRSDYSISRAFICWSAGIAMVYCTLFGTGKLLLGESMLGFVLLAAAVVATSVLRASLDVPVRGTGASPVRK